MDNTKHINNRIRNKPNKFINFFNRAFWYGVNAVVRFPGYYPVHADGMKFKCDPYNIKFWKTVSNGSWEPETYKVLSKFLNQDMVYYDIGAWIGPTVIYAAKKCRQVVCFEPDTVAYQYLLWNVRMNNLYNVLPINAALADQDGILQLSSVSNKLGDSESSLLKIKSPFTIDVPAFSWETWITYIKMEAPAFLKIDIEGGEFLLLPAMKAYLSAHKPIVYLSTHAPLLDAALRKEQMSRIMDVMSVYKNCLNGKLEPVSVYDLIEDRALENNQSYVFLD